MKWITRLKVAIVLVAVALVTVDFAAQGRQATASPVTLSAAGDSSVKAGIKTYRIRKPHRPADDPDAIVMDVELLDDAQSRIGRFTERTKGSGDTRSRHTELELRWRRIATIITGKFVRVFVDGREIYSGAFTPADPAAAAILTEVRDLFVLMDAIAHDVEKVRHESEKLSADWARVSFVPRRLRPVALSLSRWLPTGVTLHASGLEMDEDGPRCPSDFKYCENATGWTRSNACSDAKIEANGECSDWVNCIGCCGWAAADCDCACVNEDIVCWCIACGARCEVGPPLE